VVCGILGVVCVRGAPEREAADTEMKIEKTKANNDRNMLLI